MSTIELIKEMEGLADGAIEMEQQDKSEADFVVRAHDIKALIARIRLLERRNEQLESIEFPINMED